MIQDCLRSARPPLLAALVGALVCLGLAPPLRAEEPEAPAEGQAQMQAEWRGTIRGQVVDGRSGAPVGYATVTLIWPTPADGGEARRDVQVSDPNGAFEFASVPAGVYTLSFSKTGYQTSTLVDFTAQPDRLDRADFQLPPLAPEPTEPGEAPAGVEEFLVLGARVEALEASRAESDELINTLSAEEFAKFAATDVAEALKYVAGVNVVEGQFAIIRGLEDRYSSTLYNSAPIPSPDPDKQSVQLDLFASDIVGNLVVAKTFGPDLPSNSSGGSINILTHDYPDEIEVKLQAGTGLNENAYQEFLRFESGSAVGVPDDGTHTIESDFAGSLGGRLDWLGREVRFKGVVAREIDYQTAEGFQEARQPRKPDLLFEGSPSQMILRSGSLAFGELALTAGKFDLDISDREERRTAYGGLGFDLDEAGEHRLDGSIFYTRNDLEAVEWRQNGYLEGFDYGVLAADQADNGIIDDPSAFFPPVSGIGGCQQAVCATQTAWIATTVRDGSQQNPVRGPLWYSSFLPSRSFDIQRDLLVYQINGDHQVPLVEGMRFSWAANLASTTQQETALGARIFYEPAFESDPNFPIPTQFPITPDDLFAADAAVAAGFPFTTNYATNGGVVSSVNDIDETGYFVRFDLEWEREVFSPLTLKFASGGWFESADRDVSSEFLESATVGQSTNYAIEGETPQALGSAIFETIDPGFLRFTTNDSTRDIQAGHFGLKATLWNDFDLLGGLRVEDIRIRSDNDPFTGEIRTFGPATFPDVYILFDRPDNPERGETGVFNPNAFYNDQLLGIDVPLAPCQAPGGAIPNPANLCVDLWNPLDPTDTSAIEPFVNGEIQELEFLPSAGLAYRPLEGLSLRAAWSRTVARPSFREMGFYASVELGTDDLVVGNPQLELSKVESWDARAEYTWGELGELAAVSAFYKTIDDPIESIVVRNPTDPQGNALYRTFFNNPNTATLWGVEVEARKNLGFLGPELLEYLSLGGNFTYIDATVDRTEAELGRSQVFFLTEPGDTATYTRIPKSRRLFGQPEWIVNTDLTFDLPDWGTRLTLVLFAISDLLDAAGTADLSPDLRVTALTLDRYIDSFYTLDFVFSQTFPFDVPLGWLGLEGTVPSALTFKTNVKNLTDSTRRIVYDRDLTEKRVAERSFKIGRDYSFSLTYSFAF